MPEKTDDIQLRSEEVQEILTRPPHWMIRYGSLLFLSLILLLLVFSWFIKYPDIIPSQAVLLTRTPPQKEYARTTARLQHLLVEDNQQVSEGTTLAVLENPADYRDVLLLKAALDTVKIDAQDFAFPIDELPRLFLGDLEADFAVFQNNYIQYRLNKELQPFATRQAADRITEAELRSQLALLENQRDLNERELEFKKNEHDRHRTLHEKGVISSQEYEDIQLEYLQAEKNFRNLKVSISQLRDNISAARRGAGETLFAMSSEERNLINTTLQSFNQLRKAIRDWELQYAFITHIDGRVSFLDVWAENQTVQTGSLLFTIVPVENSTFIARLKTPALNAGKIKTGQRVNLRLQNYPDEEFGMLSARVTNISLLPDGEGLYTVEAMLTEDSTVPGQAKLITTYDREIDFTQEIPAQAEIVTEDLRLMERFFYQFRNLLRRN